MRGSRSNEYQRPTAGVEEDTLMQSLIPTAEKIAVLLKARKQTIAVAESSTGGLIAAILLAVPGASAYFLGGAVVYTRESRRALMGITDDAMKGLRSSSEPYAQLLATTAREQCRHGGCVHAGTVTWGSQCPEGCTDRPAQLRSEAATLTPWNALTYSRANAANDRAGRPVRA